MSNHKPSLVLALLTAHAIVLPAQAANFFVDHAAIYRTALDAALKEYPELSKDDLGLTSNSLLFRCDSQQNWEMVHPHRLEIPHQRRSTTLCNTWLELIIQSSWKQVSIEPADIDGYCWISHRYQSIAVTVYSDGTADAEKRDNEPGGTERCDKVTQFYKVEDLIEQYRQVAYPDPIQAE
ncbi:hypothetical protein [Microbulbifer magnicolonia]|uniref:hypothetical protein n=1 Tax=Microbulbifer magnicolonia TaxID=3109744 RepID=UPI002B415459|nr:hypothetical protein [Microbulbifer sp. GG15]